MSDDVFKRGNLAVITGAAMGIGLAVAKACAARGMRVCMVDVDAAELTEAMASVEKDAAAGGGGLTARTLDVRDGNAIADLAQRIAEEYGAPAFVMNNAVTRIGGDVDASIDDWRQAMEVNFWGVLNGVNAFLPPMLTAKKPAIIVNTGSKQGITNPPGNLAYNVTKSALKTYTEGLQHHLRNIDGCQVSAHLLIPGWTTTGKRDHQPGAWLPHQVADYMFDALAAGSFYILCPDNEVSREMDIARIRWGADDICENRPPISRWHPEHKKLFEESQ